MEMDMMMDLIGLSIIMTIDDEPEVDDEVQKETCSD
jgi:hypothetical protein